MSSLSILQHGWSVSPESSIRSQQQHCYRLLFLYPHPLLTLFLPLTSSLTLFLAFNPHPSSRPPFSFNGTRNEGRKERVEICFQAKLTICQNSFALSRRLTNLRQRDEGVNGLINPISNQWPYLNIDKQIQISCKCAFKACWLLRHCRFFLPLYCSRETPFLWYGCNLF